jgi:hypothetical protein
MTAPARTSAPTVRLPSGRPTPAGTRRGTGRGAGSLRLVPPRLPARIARARRTPFVAVVVGLLALGLLGMLALNTVLAQDAFRLHALQVQGKVLADREQALQTSVDALQAPRALASRAEAFGMVPGGAPDFLRMPDGVLLGADQAPPGAAQPDLVGKSVVPAPAPAAAADAAQAARSEAADEAQRSADGTAGTTTGTGTSAGTGTGSITGTGTSDSTDRTSSRSTTGTTSGSTR